MPHRKIKMSVNDVDRKLVRWPTVKTRNATGVKTRSCSTRVKEIIRSKRVFSPLQKESLWIKDAKSVQKMVHVPVHFSFALKKF